MKRLTPDREKDIRNPFSGVVLSLNSIQELLSEIDALREDLIKQNNIIRVQAHIIGKLKNND